MKKVFVGPLLWLVLSFIVAPAAAQTPEAAARQVMDQFITTFNARDAQAWSQTLLFPHVRIASGGVTVYPDRDSFVANTDLEAFASTNNWSHSAWEQVELIQAGPEKVHFKVRFARFNPAGEKYAVFESLYILQKDGERWGIRARSSFAP